MKFYLAVIVIFLIYSCSEIKDKSTENKSPKDTPKVIQNIKISGKVLSSIDSSALSGAVVIITGTTNGTITNNDGDFVLMVLEKDSINLTFATKGYVSANLRMDPQAEHNIYLAPKSQE